MDTPLDKLAQIAQEVLRRGGTIFQKFTCCGCGARQTMDTPNTLYTTGTCEECGYDTDLTQHGAKESLMVVWGPLVVGPSKGGKHNGIWS